ncbi:MAG: cytochrome c, partial [Chloroflexi bacterium]|nr:cytochrome c [Chloroflexota bacterium]
MQGVSYLGAAALFALTVSGAAASDLDPWHTPAHVLVAPAAQQTPAPTATPAPSP